MPMSVFLELKFTEPTDAKLIEEKKIRRENKKLKFLSFHLP